MKFMVAAMAAASVFAQEDTECQKETGIPKSCKVDDDCCDALVCKNNFLTRGSCEEDCQDFRKWCTYDEDCCGDMVCYGICDDASLRDVLNEIEFIPQPLVEEEDEEDEDKECQAEKGVPRTCVRDDDCCDDLVCKGNFLIGHTCEDNCARFREYCVYDEDCCGDEYKCLGVCDYKYDLIQ